MTTSFLLDLPKEGNNVVDWHKSSFPSLLLNLTAISTAFISSTQKKVQREVEIKAAAARRGDWDTIHYDETLTENKLVMDSMYVTTKVFRQTLIYHAKWVEFIRTLTRYTRWER